MLQSLHLAGPLVAMLQSMLHDCRACFRAAWTSDNFVDLDGYFAEWAVEEKNIALVAKNKRLPVAHRRDGCDPINALSDPEKRLRMYIASICTLGVNSSKFLSPLIFFVSLMFCCF